MAAATSMEQTAISTLIAAIAAQLPPDKETSIGLSLSKHRQDIVAEPAQATASASWERKLCQDLLDNLARCSVPKQDKSHATCVVAIALAKPASPGDAMTMYVAVNSRSEQLSAVRNAQLYDEITTQLERLWTIMRVMRDALRATGGIEESANSVLLAFRAQVREAVYSHSLAQLQRRIERYWPRLRQRFQQTGLLVRPPSVAYGAGVAPGPVVVAARTLFEQCEALASAVYTAAEGETRDVFPVINAVDALRSGFGSLVIPHRELLDFVDYKGRSTSSTLSLTYWI
ncbi:hypothetical protein AURDEDRAFT_162553 [Auricularia subglabra TFB-10046 SS5]|nr:hypothetical protein AURDEDRAFT_162553 [Auricularia subglabra TFB-10046 SS5]